ncbi:MAG: amidohydrolase family protein [Chloroflexi bacterium]|nr:amidohydrolase family protein [Chloroflexota bacterium]MDL1885403.1 amidohydrolase family protein [Anaerolineae bacterium CFX8]
MPYSLLCNGTLIDGTGTKPLRNGGILLDGRYIRTVGPVDSLTLPNTTIEEIDAEGGFIMPGFIDTHVHIMIENFNLAQTMQTPFSLNFYKAINHMRRTLDAGITGVRDAGGADLGVKMAVETGLVEGPRMQICVTMLSTTGGHGDSWMPGGLDMPLFPAHPGRPDGRCDGVDGVRKKVREVLRAGADVVKVAATGGVLSPTDHPEFTQFSPEELAVIVQEASFRRGIRVMAHAQGAEGVKNAVRAGVHSIEHGIYLDNEAIELMLERGTFLVPTLLAPVSVVQIAEAAGTMPAYGVRKAREVLDIHRESIARAYKAGVKIVMGTDAGVMPHGTNMGELALLCGVGMSPLKVITAATQTAAECLGWGDWLGTLEPNKIADIIVSKANPLNDIHVLENPDNIILVIKDGVIVKDLRSRAA